MESPRGGRTSMGLGACPTNRVARVRLGAVAALLTGWQLPACGLAPWPSLGPLALSRVTKTQFESLSVAPRALARGAPRGSGAAEVVGSGRAFVGA